MTAPVHIESTEPGGKHFTIRYNETKTVLTRLSKTGRINTISMTKDEVIAVANALIDSIEVAHGSNS